MPTGHSVPLPYTPAPPPSGGSADLQELARATWDEFYRIQLVLAALDRPMALSAPAIEPIPVDVLPAYARLLNSGAVPVYELPPGMLNTATGVITIPQEGLWQVNIIVSVPPFPVPGNREYTLDVQLTLDPVVGGTVVRTVSTNGQDTQDLSIGAPAAFTALQGDLLWLDARCRMPGGVPGSINAQVRFSLYRISGVR